LIVVSSVLTTCQAQSEFEFRNRSFVHGIDAPVFDASRSLLWGPDWRVELWGGASPDSLSPAHDWYNWNRVTIPLHAPGSFRSPNPVVIPSVPPFRVRLAAGSGLERGLGANLRRSSGAGTWRLGGNLRSSTLAEATVRAWLFLAL
jgi:hypothetical protein